MDQDPESDIMLAPEPQTASIQEPIVAPWYDANEVQPCFRNKIMTATIFKLKPGATDKTDVNQHIPLKTFAYCVIGEERRSYLMTEMQKIYHHMPLTHYDPAKNDYEQRAFFCSSHKDDNWLSIPFDQQVFQKFGSSESVGCQHYVRGCEVKCKICDKYFGCRHCHNDEVLDHIFPRFETTTVRCYYCRTEQPIGKECSNCGKRFGEHFCLKCKQINGIGFNGQSIFHCSGCNVCITGVECLTQHCEKCNNCYDRNSIDSHKCVPEQGDCIVCFGCFEGSIYGRIILDCGHQIHPHCYEMLIRNFNLSCPLCKKTLLVDRDRKHIIPQLKKIYQTTFVQEGKTAIQCNDCQRIFLHNIGGFVKYCPKCKLFNCQTIDAQTFKDRLETVEFDIRAPHCQFDDFKQALSVAFPEKTFQQILEDANLPMDIAWSREEIEIIVEQLRNQIDWDYTKFIGKLKLAVAISTHSFIDSGSARFRE